MVLTKSEIEKVLKSKVKFVEFEVGNKKVENVYWIVSDDRISFYYGVVEKVGNDKYQIVTLYPYNSPILDESYDIYWEQIDNNILEFYEALGKVKKIS